MRLSCKHILSIIVICGVASAASAQTFSTPSLGIAAQRLGLMTALAQMTACDTTLYVPDGEDRVRVRLSEQGLVEHIGWPLFNVEMRRLSPSPVYDFLEYAVVEKHYQLNDNPLPLQRVRFNAGSWQKLEQIADTMPCFVDNNNDKEYVVRWGEGTKPIVEVTFPIDYELLLHDTRRNLMRSFIEGLKRWKGDVPEPPAIESTQLAQADTAGIYVRKGTSYLSPMITTDTYYAQVADTLVEDSDTLISRQIRPVWNRALSEKSVANLMLGIVPGVAADMELQFIMDTKNTQTVKTTLKQWLSYCMKHGCTLYWGAEKTDEETLSGSLFMQNKAYGYDHVMHITVPIQQIGRQECHLKGRVHLYAPTSNVDNLFLEP